LTHLRCGHSAIERDAKIVRPIETLIWLNEKSPKEFWKGIEGQTKKQ
jgi:hypothetical protein